MTTTGGSEGGGTSTGTSQGSASGLNLADLITYLQNTMTTPNVGAVSDQLAQSYIQSSTQQQIAALQQASALQQSEQSNALRQAELMGADPTGQATDAATRWRQELQAQQQVQNDRLAQQQAQLLGWDASGQATLEARNAAATQANQNAQLYGYGAGGAPTLAGQAQATQAAQRNAEIYGYGEGGAPTLAGQAQAAAAAARQAELMGWDASGTATLASRQLAQQAQESEADRNLRYALQSGQLGQQESEFARSYLLQQENARRANAQLSGTLDNGQLTEEARAARAREALQTGTAVGNVNGQQTEEARAARAREALQAGTAVGSIGGQQTEEARAARAREALQAGTALGTINGQQTEEARAARAREALAAGQTSGYMDTGQLTEAARAARAQELQQRATTTADLTRNSKDVFRAANYFKTMQQGAQNGLAGSLGFSGGTAGFTTQDNRNQGTPGTIGYDDAAAATGAQMPAMSGAGGGNDGPAMAAAMAGAAGVPAMGPPGQAPGAPIDRAAGLIAPQAPAGAPQLPAGMTPPAMPTGGLPALPAGATPPPPPKAGTQPGGPVGMGAGGSFVDRRPQVTHEHLKDPRVQKFFKQLGDHLGSGTKASGTQPGGPQGSQGSTRGSRSFHGTLESDRRAQRGLKSLHKKIMQNMVPGSQPGGPVDAPMWPTGGSGAMTNVPSVPQPQSVGAAPQMPTPSSAAAAPAASPFAQADTGAMDARLASFQQYLQRYGAQGLAPQTMEAMGSTEKGVTESALEALGLNKDDFLEAYAASRFHNVGSALSA